MGLNFYYYDGLQPKMRAGMIKLHECTSLLKGATFMDFLFFKNFLRLFNWLCIKDSNVPGAPFIQGGTFIPDSRVGQLRAFLSFALEVLALTYHPVIKSYQH